MAEKETVLTVDTNQVAASNLTEITSAPIPTDVPISTDSPATGPLDPAGAPISASTSPEASTPIEDEAQAKAAGAPGIEGEEVIWEARYSMKNFLGRLIVRTLLTLAWVAMAIYTWGYDHTGVGFFTIMLGVVVTVLWIALLYRMVLARCGHEYQLTNRRLFVSTGLMRRRRDQMELLRVKDVFTRQTLLDGWLQLGTVVVVSNEPSLPTFYLAGVDDPKRVMDLVWHHARVEREGKSVQVDNV